MDGSGDEEAGGSAPEETAAPLDCSPSLHAPSVAAAMRPVAATARARTSGPV